MVPCIHQNVGYRARVRVRKTKPCECYPTKQSRHNPEGSCRFVGSEVIFSKVPRSVDEAGAGRLCQRCGERAVILAVGAGELGDLAQVIFRLLAVTLLEL